MNILFSVQNLGLGGVTTYVLHLAAGLSKRHKVIVYDHNPYYYDAAFCKWLPKEVVIEQVGIHDLRDRIIWKLNALILKTGSGFKLWEYLKNRHFRKVTQKYSIQVITSFDKFSDKIVAEQIGQKIPLVISMHGSYDISSFYRFPEKEIGTYESVFRTAKAIIYKADCNIRILDHYNNLDNITCVKKVLHGFVFENPTADPILLRAKLGIGPESFVFGMIGRGVPEKGWKEALAAFDQLCRITERDIHFVAIGKSEYLESLKHDFASNQRIHFTGFVENSLDWINTINVGVLPTYAQTENFTFSVVEYMFCGKPAVTTDHGEISTTVDANGEKAAILTPLKDGKPDVEKLVLAMKTYLDDKTLYDQHATLALKAFEKFDSDFACSEYERVFNTLVVNHTQE